MAKIDLIGQRFGKLVVLKENGRDHGAVSWECLCDCGKTITTSSWRLRGGSTKSCGCYNKERTHETRFKDISGQRFGRLVVISPVGKSPNREFLWNVKCDCGTEKVLSGSVLRSGITISCGCYLKDEHRSRHESLTGKKFGRLLVKEIDPESKPSRIKYFCNCDCGNTVSVRADALRGGTTQSCGCYAIERSIEKRTTHGLSGTKLYSRIQARKQMHYREGLDVGWTPEMEFALREFQKFCSVCGITEEEHQIKYNAALQTDHVLPAIRGNGLIPGNAVLLCASCNPRKSDKLLKDLPLDWQASIIWNAIQFKNYWEGLQENKVEEILPTQEQLDVELKEWTELLNGPN
jgi:hypothetical protein